MLARVAVHVAENAFDLLDHPVDVPVARAAPVARGGGAVRGGARGGVVPVVGGGMPGWGPGAGKPGHFLDGVFGFGVWGLRGEEEWGEEGWRLGCYVGMVGFCFGEGICLR